MKVSIIGLGTIGKFLLKEINDDENFEIAGVSELDEGRAHAALESNGLPKSLLTSISDLPEETDLIIESASVNIAREVALSGLKAGVVVVIASIGGLGDIDDLNELAIKYGGRLILPSGALSGLDALKAIPTESIKSVNLKSIKPASNWAGYDYIIENGIDLDSLKEPLKIFEGTSRDAARAFPMSANVAATLGLATVGLDDVRVEVWADPFSNRNRHLISIESGHGTIMSEISNVPFEANPRTSRLAAYSILASVRNLINPVVIGT